MIGSKRKTVVILHYEYMNLYRNKEMGLFACRLMSLGFEVRFIAPSEASEPVVPWGENFQLVTCPGNDGLNPEWILEYLGRIREDIFCIWSYMNSKAYRYLVPFCRKAGASSIIHLDAYRIEAPRRISRWHSTSRSMAGATAVLCQEPEMIENFASAAVRRRCLLYPASFDAERADHPSIRAAVRRNQVIISGQVYEVKRTHLAVEAFLGLLESHPTLHDWRLVIAGECIDAAYAKRIRERQARSPHGDNVQVLGQLSGDDYYRTLAESRILIHPSSREGQANVFPEAMFFGLAILTTHGSKVRHLLNNGEAGMVVPTDDLPALTDALRVLMEDNELCVELGRRARERQQMMFDFETNFDRLLKFVSSTIA